MTPHTHHNEGGVIIVMKNLTHEKGIDFLQLLLPKMEYIQLPKS